MRSRFNFCCWGFWWLSTSEVISRQTNFTRCRFAIYLAFKHPLLIQCLYRIIDITK